jgi:ThiF family
VSETAHPLLPAGTPVLRSADGSVRIGGVDSTDGLVAGAGWVAGLVAGLDGRRPQRTVVADGVRAGVPPAQVHALLAALRDAGLLVDLDAADLLATGAGPAAAARTAVELPAAAGPGGGSRWAARRAATVLVDGATRVGVPLAAVLAASGVGRVPVRDDGPAGAGDAVVGGLTAADEGRPRSAAAADAVRRASPLTDLRPLAEPADADVVVLTRPAAACDPLAAALVEGGVPHLVATVRGQTGVVGPLVVPGRTGCLGCADLHRRDADPSWPLLAARLGAAPPSPAGATTTCLLTAVTAAVQVLAHLDGAGAPVALGATVELRPPDLAPHVRLWPPHPGCSCGAPIAARDTPPTCRAEDRAAHG